MTENQAWNYLATLWRSPKNLRNRFFVKIEDETCVGLCSCIGALYARSEISSLVRGRMFLKVQLIPRIENDCMCWPTDSEGSRLRAEFCLKKAKETIMSEKEAWEYLARLWSEPVVGIITAGVYMFGCEAGYQTCLCRCIDELRLNDEINTVTAMLMREKILKANTECRVYLFPRDKNGAMLRAQFCAARAKEL